MKEIKFNIIKTIAVLSETESGWKKEVNLVSWNDADPKIDIRTWDSEHKKMGKGITLSEEELNILKQFI